MRRLAGLIGIALLCGTLPALAQSSGIAGLVRDSSGAVLPGVTVEASSPALIERTRSVVTDSQGRVVSFRNSIVILTSNIGARTFAL